MLIPLFTLFEPILFTNIRINFLCNIVTLSCRLFFFFLSQFFTSTCYVLHTFIFFPTQSAQGVFTGPINVVLNIVCPYCLILFNTQQCFFPTFKSPLDNDIHVFSLSTFSVASLMNRPCVRFSIHFSFRSFAFCFLNSTFVIFSLVLIVSAAYTPQIRFSSNLANC